MDSQHPTQPLPPPNYAMQAGYGEGMAKPSQSGDSSFHMEFSPLDPNASSRGSIQARRFATPSAARLSQSMVLDRFTSLPRPQSMGADQRSSNIPQHGWQQQHYRDQVRAQQQARRQSQGQQDTQHLGHLQQQQQLQTHFHDTDSSTALAQRHVQEATPDTSQGSFNPSVSSMPAEPGLPQYINLTQQLSQQVSRSASPTLRYATTTALASPRSLIPEKTPERARMVLQQYIPSRMPQYKAATMSHTHTIQHNKSNQHTDSNEEQIQQLEQRAKRRRELREDPNALYHRYHEILEYFPLDRGERPSPYLVGLLANQSMPTEPTSDRGVAIKYAKKHWQNYWELKDLDVVVSKARKRKTLGEEPLTKSDTVAKRRKR